MYGFGDDQNPYTESVDILEDLVIEFITEMVGSYNMLLLIRHLIQQMLYLGFCFLAVLFYVKPRRVQRHV